MTPSESECWRLECFLFLLVCACAWMVLWVRLFVVRSCYWVALVHDFSGFVVCCAGSCFRVVLFCA